MNSKGHLVVSILKSVLRMGACLWTICTGNVFVLAMGLFLAEGLGIVEELVDKRK